MSRVVRAVAIDAGRSSGVAAQQGRAVNALLVGGDEARARGHLLPHRLVLQVTRQAEALLGSFPREEVGNRVGGRRLAMTREAGRLLRGARALARTVLGAEQLPGDLAVAPPARGDFPRRRERKGRVLDRRRVVSPVAAEAIRLGRLPVGAGEPAVERVRGRRRVVAARAIHGPGLRRVGKIRRLAEIRVAVDAGESRLAVDRLPRRFGAATKTRRAVGPLRVGVAVAGQAVFVGRRLWLRRRDSLAATPASHKPKDRRRSANLDAAVTARDYFLPG